MDSCESDVDDPRDCSGVDSAAASFRNRQMLTCRSTEGSSCDPIQLK